MWEWSFPGGTPSVSTEKNPVITYDSIGTYDVKLIASNGFYSDSVLSVGYIVVDFPTFTRDKNESSSCTILPNPSNGIFTLNMNSSQTDQLELAVFDMVGNRVYSEKNLVIAGQLNKTVNLTMLLEGIYFMKISGEHGMTTRKMVIKK